jgi:hypothetical protein
MQGITSMDDPFDIKDIPGRVPMGIPNRYRVIVIPNRQEKARAVKQGNVDAPGVR